MKTPEHDDPSRGGRPRLGAGYVRRNRTLRYTDQEWSALQRRATEAGCSLTEFLYAAALARALPPRIPEVNRELYASLRQAGGNLNQVAHQLNLAALGGGVAPSTEDLAATLQELKREFRELRAALLGRKST